MAKPSCGRNERLCRRPERRRVLIVVSDGAPRDEATERANGADYLARHLRSVVAAIEAHSPVQIAAIGGRARCPAVLLACDDDDARGGPGEALSNTLISFLCR